jgi:hypothetical protein
MTDSEAVVQFGAEVTAPVRPRSAYIGHRAFGSGDGAVLVEPDVTRELRSAAEFAAQEGRFTGGLLYGRGWTDDQGFYLVVDGYLEAGPGENGADRIGAGDAGDFTLSEADLRLLRADAARSYSASFEVGWWRTLAALGEFGPADFVTQAELTGLDGVGLLVYGSGIHWGTAYLGPDGHAPDTAGTLTAVGASAYAAGRPAAAASPETKPAEFWPGAGPAGDPLAGDAPGDPAPSGAGPGTTLATRPLAPLVRRPAETRVISPVSAPAREWGAREGNPGVGPEMPTDAKVVVAGLLIVPVIMAVMIGMLVSSVLVAVIAAVLFDLVVLGVIKMSRL